MSQIHNIELGPVLAFVNTLLLFARNRRGGASRVLLAQSIIVLVYIFKETDSEIL